MGVSVRQTCRVLEQARPTQRHSPQGPQNEAVLTAVRVTTASRYGRYGYRRITAKLHKAGWRVNPRRVERLWRREGLKVPRSNPRGGVCGRTVAPVSGCALSTSITAGHMTS